ncbi:hypothetical protein A5635_17820 [Mycobacterium asiaticum]|uniref:Uncharacterized protein n=1 Tax=Mycobacterium asiaticum TaxID=1790 RepID=A0A1A3UR81_MYCAS|nr:hypothetical protein [Mycobacterium asiaticum]OBK24271.1 hypothetical protein A5635_17820 [Mycobacterium asiaticum]OBK97533.1 hypothetical protein A5645_06220 [Mycobacterium asiaticum]
MFGVLGAAAVLGSLFGLTLPLSLQVVDRGGTPIACGTGFHPDRSVAAHEDVVNRDLQTHFGAPYEPSDYTAQCDAMVAARRDISFSVMAFGGGLLAVTVLLTLRAAGYVDFSRRSRSQRWATGGRAVGIPPAPAPVRYCDDLSSALSSIGIRVQH